MNYAIIHVADIHYRKDAPEGASSIMKAFLKDLGERTQALSDHRFYIVFAGDIVRAGEDSDAYDAFAREMDANLNKVGIGKDSRIVVPGNHDLNKRAVEDAFEKCEKAIDEYTGVEEKFNDFIEKSSLLSGHFSNYESFLRGFARCSESFQSRGWGCELNDDIAVYCLNSALCSFGGASEVNDEGRLAIYTRNLSEWCNRTTCPVKILVHHHPLDHLNHWSATELQHIITDNFTLCLSGHNHRPELYFSQVPQKSLMCTAPPLFCGKDTILGYTVVLIENNVPSALIYREYSGGRFFPSARLAKTASGRVELGDPYLRHLHVMEMELHSALEPFKGQPSVFVEPKLSKKREFNDDQNELHALIDSPYDTLVVAPPQFGLTCLGLHMRLEAFKKHNFWEYVDAERTTAKRICSLISADLLHYKEDRATPTCFVLDNWNAGEVDHLAMVRNVIDAYPEVPVIILATDSVVLDTMGSLSRLNREFKLLHLQALSRGSMRQLVARYNADRKIGTEDVVLARLAEHMESINIHRTPLNCYTLLRVLDSSYNEKLVNKSKLMKAILFVLFTDSESFSYLGEKPEVDECAYVLGCFCSDLVLQGTRRFDASSFLARLKEICRENSIVLNVEAMVGVLVENSILLRRGNEYEFRHRFWIFYFAAEWMVHSNNFRQAILRDRNYVNYPEIMELYSGIDGRRTDAMEVLLSDLNSLIGQVDGKIGIERSFDPLSTLLWNPTDEYIRRTRSQIAEKVESSNLPADIKDKHADRHYQSVAPYDQSIRTFLKDYSVLSLLSSIKAASRALRNSPFVKVELRHSVASAIFQGWEEISRVAFWISPMLAKEGRAVHDGFAIRLAEGFSADLEQRFKEIICANPSNIVRILKDDLVSRKIGPLLSHSFLATDSKLQKHMIALFIATVRPSGWHEATLDYIDLLHPSSFYLGDILWTLSDQVRLGDLEQGEETSLKSLAAIILAKREYAPRVSDRGDRELAPNSILSEENRMAIDKLLKGNRRRWPWSDENIRKRE